MATQETIQLLQDLGIPLRPERPYASWLGLALVAYGLVGLSALAIRQFRPEVSRETKQLGLVALVFVLVALLARIVSLWSWDGAPFLIPVALGSMLITILIDAHVAVLTTLVAALVTGLVTDYALEPMVVALVGGITAI